MYGARKRKRHIAARETVPPFLQDSLNSRIFVYMFLMAAPVLAGILMLFMIVIIGTRVIGAEAEELVATAEEAGGLTRSEADQFLAEGLRLFGWSGRATDRALYDELFAPVEHADVLQVFEQLRDASQDKHLPAFERCVGR